MSKQLEPPFYILINDSDLRHVKFYHDFGPGANYEGEFGIWDSSAYTKARGCFHVGPRRMHYIETALKFRDKIAKVKNLSIKDLKIVRVENSLSDTGKRAKKGELKPVTFEGIWR